MTSKVFRALPDMPQIVMRAPIDLRPNPRNARTHTDEEVDELAAVMRTFGFVGVDPTDIILAGHRRTKAAIVAGIPEIPVFVAGADWTDEQLRAFVLIDNQQAQNAGWDEAMLAAELRELSESGFNMALTGFDEATLERALADEMQGVAAAVQGMPLAERFGIVPFSVFNAREGWWQDRKRAWLALGIKSELGRGENALGFSATILQPDPAKRAKKAGR